MTRHDLPEAYWRERVIAGPWTTAEASLAALRSRDALYPGMPELLPAGPGKGKVVLDYGCGPGHDVLRFLLAGAAHVYAADISPVALAVVDTRLRLHDLRDRAQLILLPARLKLLRVDYALCAGVLHHASDPVDGLREIATALRAEAELRVMVYSAESWWYRVYCEGDPALFSARADGASPLNRAWTRKEFLAIADEAGFTASYLGSYRVPGEPEGPGVSACYALRRS